MRIQMWQVDAFASVPFRGNPAAVILVEEWPEDDVMQSIADENNLSETAFVRTAPDGHAIRWFTPVHEAGFCGHATLAAAHVLFTEKEATGRLSFMSAAGKLDVEKLADGYRLDLPAVPWTIVSPSPEWAIDLFGASVRTVFANYENYFVELECESTVRRFKPDSPILSSFYPKGVCITAAGSEVDFVSRYFAPGSGIAEDPVTGSTHATLAPFWAERLDRRQLRATQLSRRRGDLDLELDGDRVLITGSAVTFLWAEIRF